MENKEKLFVRELLERVYKNFEKDGQKINLPEEVLIEIANDSDYHRERVGYFSYKSAVLIDIKNHERLMAFGKKWGDYPADRYDCGIIAVSFSGRNKSEERIIGEIKELFESISYFRYSLIVAMADGQLTVSRKGFFSQRVLSALKPKINSFISQKLEIDHRYIEMDGRPVVKSPIMYKPEFGDFLYKSFYSILS